MLHVQVPLNAVVPVFVGNTFNPRNRLWMKQLLSNERAHLLNCMNEFPGDAFPDPHYPQVLGIALVRYAGSYDGINSTLKVEWGQLQRCNCCACRIHIVRTTAERLGPRAYDWFSRLTIRRSPPIRVVHSSSDRVDNYMFD